MDRQTIPAGWLTLRPFTTADIPWVYDVSLDPALQHFTGVPTPYRMEHAAFFVQQMAIAGWDSGQRADVPGPRHRHQHPAGPGRPGRAGQP
jgi:hypothetical protein